MLRPSNSETLGSVLRSYHQGSGFWLFILHQILSSILARNLPNYANVLVLQIVNATVIQAASFFTWGYRWRKSYKALSTNEAVQICSIIFETRPHCHIRQFLDEAFCKVVDQLQDFRPPLMISARLDEL
jgi:hypothetical protein